MGRGGSGAGHILVGHQPAYLPWPGYFSRLLDGPRFLLLDHVQFSARSWQQRNYIADRYGRYRLTVPVRHRFGQAIADVCIADDRWRQRHWRIITQSYRRARYWPQWEARLAGIYAQPWERLASLNEALIALLLEGFGIEVHLVRSSALQPVGRKTEMLIDLCRISGTSTLRVGTGAFGYLDAAALARAGVDVEVATYTNPVYEQGRSGFTSGLSSLDLLLHRGPDARRTLAAGASLRPWTSSPTAVRS